MKNNNYKFTTTFSIVTSSGDILEELEPIITETNNENSYDAWFGKGLVEAKNKLEQYKKLRNDCLIHRKVEIEQLHLSTSEDGSYFS